MTDRISSNSSKWIDSLREAYALREKELGETYDRSLPFQDAMFDRRERAERLGFGPGATIYNSALVFGQVAVGRDTWIGPYVILDGAGGGIAIGSTCSISTGVQIYTHDSVKWALSGGTLPYQHNPVSIGDCCYIGPQSIITAGVSISKRCVIAANSMVSENVPPNTIVGGTPARKLGHVEMRGPEPILVFKDTQDRKV